LIETALLAMLCLHVLLWNDKFQFVVFRLVIFGVATAALFLFGV